MASSSRVQLLPTQQVEYYRGTGRQDSTNTASELLQINHDKHHIFFNQSGFHNHIAHHLLTIWALGAGPGDIQHAYDINADYQRPQAELDEAILQDLRDPAKFIQYLGNQKYYYDYMIFFQGEMDNSGYEDVVNRYLLAGDECADDLLSRLYAGFLHPIIHLGLGIEFRQPAIVAEALAQAAVHGPYMNKFFLPAERAAKDRANEPSKTMVQLLEEIQADADIVAAPHWSDDNKLRDGIIGRAAERMVSYVSQYRVQPNELERKTAEMTNAVAYYTAGAQRDDRQRKYDFYYMHCVNCSIFFSSFLKQSWISEANKVRLLQWKVWNDLAMYASRKCPKIRMDLVRDYQPKKPSGWDGIEDRVTAVEDDGHAAKLVRALAHGQKICEPYESREEFMVKHDDWLQMGHMAIDSVEAGEPHWVRSAGFDEAWEKVPLRSQL